MIFEVRFPEIHDFFIHYITFTMCALSETDQKNRIHVLPFSQTVTMMPPRVRDSTGTEGTRACDELRSRRVEVSERSVRRLIFRKLIYAKVISQKL